MVKTLTMDSKMLVISKTFCKKLGLIFLLLLVSACTSKVDRADSKNIATFFVDNIDGTSEVSKTDAVFALPKARLYNFKTCIKDIMQSKAIQNQSFKIIGGDNEKTVNTDEQGCLNWSENIEYNFIAQSNYIELQRTIVANGIHKGSADIKLVLNPWARGEDIGGVIDPSKKSISSVVRREQTSEALVAEGTHTPLWALNPRVTILEKEYTATGANMLLRFQTQLSLVLKSVRNQNVTYPITSGVFNVEMILYNSVIENGREILQPLANVSQNDITFTQDKIIAEFPFNLSVLPNKGQNIMGIRITAPNNDIGVDPFESIYFISVNDNLKIDGSPIAIPNKSFAEVKMALEEKNLNRTNENKDLIKPGIEIDKLEIKFFKIGSESTTDRQVFFNIKACMKSNLDKSAIRNEPFQVKTLSNKAPISLQSGLDGCISWDDSIWHKFFGKEHFVKNSISISSANFNLSKSIDILLNPWDTGANFGRDGRFIDDLGSTSLNPSSEGAKIQIDNYSFSVTRYNYEINKGLDLNLIKTGTLSLNAKVVNHSSLSSGRMGIEPLRDGQYLLKWAAITLDKNDKADSVVGIGQKIVNVFGGDIKTDISIKISAFEKLNVRSRFVVALYTIKDNKAKNGIIEIDKNSGLEATPFYATIILDNDQDNQKLQRLEDNFGLAKGDVFDRFQVLGTGTSNPSLATEKVLSTQNLKKINLSAEKESAQIRDGLANPLKYYTQTQTPADYHEAVQKQPLNKSYLINFAKTGKLQSDLAVSFCSYWFNDYFRRIKPDLKSGAIASSYLNVITQSCIENVKKDPSKFFITDKKLLIKSISNVKYINGTTSNFSVGNSFSVGRSDTNTRSTAWSAAASTGVSVEFLDFFKVGETVSYTVSNTKSSASSISSSNQVNASTYLNLQTSSFELTFDSYEECSAIKLNPELFIGKKARFASAFNSTLKVQEVAKIASSGFFICTGVNNNSPLTKRENYYLINQGFKSSHGEHDDYSLENQFFITFRGQRDLKMFLSLIQGSATTPNSSSVFDSNTTEIFSNLTMGLTKLPTWPGVYSDLDQ